MHRIIIDLYDHTSDAEADEFVREIVDRHQPSGDVRAVRLFSGQLPEAEKNARELVWRAVQNGSGITLDADVAKALWNSVLRDGIAVSALRG